MPLNGLAFPADLYYLIEHQVWARPDADGCVTIGITALGIRHSGDIYMCRPKRVGTSLEQGASVGVVELAKSVVSVKTPVSGEVIEVNPLLEDTSERVHQDPYGEGWLARIRLSDWASDQQALLHGDAQVLPAMQHHAWLNRIE